MILLNVSMTWEDILIASLIGIVIVFAVLALLVFAFKLTANLSVKNTKKKMVKAMPDSENSVLPSDIPASEIAAISMALHLFLDDTHDKESGVLTIKRIERRYSPWNSKIYGLSNLNR